MKVVVHIKYGTEEHVARILVGDAKKSIKWLGECVWTEERHLA